MMSTIGSVADLVRVIQTQFAQRPGPAGPGPARASRRAKAPANPDQLAGLIELRVRQIGRDDPQRRRKAFRLFLETVLLAQFGEGLVNDPQFYLLVDDVHAAMERDDRLQPMVDQAVDHLLAES